jgi:ClpP class serine protease
MPLVDLVYSSAWAIRPEALAAIVSLVEREDVAAAVLAKAFHFDPGKQEAALYAQQLRIPMYGVAQRPGTPVDGSRLLTRRGSVGVLAITGPIVRRASFFSSMSSSGASVDALAQELTRAVDDPSFTSILLDVDSPGGEANGIAELADAIFAARASKPVWAYVSDLGASAAYWLASAADEIVVAETAALGSIGVVAAMRDPKAAKDGVIEFVSSVSPHKRPDPTTKAGAAQIQALVDTLGTIFVDTVARNRGVSADTVISDFGAGGLKVGRDAVLAGMADRLGSFEGAVEAIAEASARPVQSAPRRVGKAASREPAAQPAPIGGERASLPIGAAESPPPARRGTMSSLRERLVALLLSEPAESVLAIDGSADQEAVIVTQNLNSDRPTEQQPAALPTPAPTPAPAPQPAPAASDGEQDVALRNRLASLEAENLRLRRQGIEREATAFVAEQVAGLKVFDPQVATLTSLYMQLAADDQQLGAIRASDGGAVLRTTLLGNYFATVQSRRDLTAELLDPDVHRVLADRREASRKAKAEETSPEAVDELLGMTAMGRQVIEDRRANGHANGSGR